MQSIQYTPEKTIQSNGLNLNYDSFGDPQHPPVVLIMGLATQMIFWHPDFCRTLASLGFWVIRFDNRDVGKSTWLTHQAKPKLRHFIAKLIFKHTNQPAYTLQDMAQDTVGLLDGLKITKCHIVGASMGGMIAQLMALHYPQRICSLTSIMSTTGSRALPKPAMGFLLPLLVSSPKTHQAQVAHGLKLYKMLHGQDFVFDLEQVTQLVEQSIQRGVNLAGNNRQFAAILAAGDRTKALQQLTIPSLILHGENDPLIHVAAGYASAEAIPNAQLKTYPGMGHTLPKELQQDMCNTIAAHCQQAEL